MSTGYDGGSGWDSSTSELLCGGPNFFPTSRRCNFMAMAVSMVPEWGPGQFVQSSVLYGMAGDMSVEYWVRPRIGANNGGLLYGADEPGGPGADRGQIHSLYGFNGFHVCCVFRDGSGMGFCFWANADVYVEQVIAFPPIMEKWFHMVCNVNRAAAVPQMEVWIDGVYTGAAGITINSNAGRTRAEFGDADGGIPRRGSLPVVGAMAHHNRLMLPHEIRNSYGQKTVSMLGTATEWAWDFRDMYFNGGITYQVISPSDELSDENLGDGINGGVSPMTFYGANFDWGAGILRQFVLDRSIYYGSMRPVAAGGDGIRFGWFDGR